MNESTEHKKAHGQELPRRFRRLGGEHLLLIAAAAWYAPLLIWARNLGEIARPGWLMLVGAAVFVVGILVALLLGALGLPPVGGAVGAATGVLFLVSGRSAFGSSGFALPILGWLVLVAIVWRLSLGRLLSPVATFMSFALVLFPVAEAVRASSAQPEPARLNLRSDTPSGLAAPAGGDVVIVVVDGYAGGATLDERFGFDNSEVVDALVDQGFIVPDDAVSNYTMTMASIASLLEGDYPVTDGPLAAADTSKLFEVMSGDNRVFRALSAAGFEVTYIESGWGGTHCGAYVDTCVGSGFFNDSVWGSLQDSLFFPWMLGTWGSPFSAGARHAMNATLATLPSMLANDEPDLLFAHILAPHPPLQVNARCELVRDPRLGGGALNPDPGSPLEPDSARARGYVEQLQCVNGFIRELAGMIGSDDVVLVAADHGSDSQGQLVTPASSWSEDFMDERFDIFLALKLTDGCVAPTEVTLVRVGQAILTCLGARDLDLPPDRQFVLAEPPGLGGGIQVREVPFRQR